MLQNYKGKQATNSQSINKYTMQHKQRTCCNKQQARSQTELQNKLPKLSYKTNWMQTVQIWQAAWKQKNAAGKSKQHEENLLTSKRLVIAIIIFQPRQTFQKDIIK